ncbi:cupin domain-containing protein [Dyella sp.]|uniref:cupin domain-containing protein n=1 Tax=Dyella sp. TaxID=1869338 RepID=UPI002ED1BF62
MAAERATFSGITADILLGGSQAPLTVMSMLVAPRQGAPAHISFDEDKVFVIEKGKLLFMVDELRLLVKAGEQVFVPRGAVHGFTCATEEHARVILVSSPSRHDAFFKAMGQLPTPHTPEAVQAVCERFRQAIVGPVIEL